MFIMNSNIYYYLDGSNQPQGPYTLAQLKELHQLGYITLESFVCEGGGQQWIAFASVFLVPDIVAEADSKSGTKNRGAEKPSFARALATFSAGVVVGILATICLINFLGNISARQTGQKNSPSRDRNKRDWTGSLKFEGPSNSLAKLDITLERVIFNRDILLKERRAHSSEVSGAYDAGMKLFACKIHVRNETDNLVWLDKYRGHGFQVIDDKGDAYDGDTAWSDNLEKAEPGAQGSGYVIFKIPEERVIKKMRWKSYAENPSSGRPIFAHIDCSGIEDDLNPHM